MNKFAISLAIALVSCASVAQIQVAAVDPAAKLPEFKTLYKFSSNGYVNNISLTAVSGMSGKLYLEGTKCFIDAVITAQVVDENFEIVVEQMTPRTPADAAFCTGIKHTITLPQGKGVLGHVTGKMDVVYPSSGRKSTAFFSFSR